jgi:cell wall-associated NlpC family hydrolase
VRSVLADAYGVELPAYDTAQSVEEAISAECLRGDWTQICGLEAAQRLPLGSPGDVVAFQLSVPKALGEVRNHIGVIVEPGHFLHVQIDGGTWVAKLHDPDWRRRMLALYRHPALADGGAQA